MLPTRWWSFQASGISPPITFFRLCPETTALYARSIPSFDGIDGAHFELRQPVGLAAGDESEAELKNEKQLNPLIRGVGLVLAVCVGVRIAAALIEPVLPSLVVLGVLLLILSFMFRGVFFRK